ncbi:MAG: hypothetical protein ACRD3J_03310, partial [Thermoanaerobaculia bacterium]
TELLEISVAWEAMNSIWKEETKDERGPMTPDWLAVRIVRRDWPKLSPQFEAAATRLYLVDNSLAAHLRLALVHHVAIGRILPKVQEALHNKTPEFTFWSDRLLCTIKTQVAQCSCANELLNSLVFSKASALNKARRRIYLNRRESECKKLLLTGE